MFAKSEVDVIACLAVREVEEHAVSGFGVVVQIVPYLNAIIDLSFGAALSFDRYGLARLVYVGQPKIKNLADAQSANPHEDYHGFCFAADGGIFNCSVIIYIVGYSWHSAEKLGSLDVAYIVVYDDALMLKPFVEGSECGSGLFCSCPCFAAVDHRVEITLNIVGSCLAEALPFAMQIALKIAHIVAICLFGCLARAERCVKIADECFYHNFPLCRVAVGLKVFLFVYLYAKVLIFSHICK